MSFVVSVCVLLTPWRLLIGKELFLKILQHGGPVGDVLGHLVDPVRVWISYG